MPVDRLGPVDSSYSFPSGHTLGSAVLLGIVLLLLVPMIRARAPRVVATAGITALALGIGLSRVYLGYHWASDVARLMAHRDRGTSAAFTIAYIRRILIRRRSGPRA